jgi:AraC-like DNA-binding protein
MRPPTAEACLSVETAPGGVEITRFGTVATSGSGRFEDFRGWISQALGAPTELATPPAVHDRFRASAQTHRAGGVLLTRLTSGPAVGRWLHEDVEAAVGDVVTVAVFHGAPPVHGHWRGQERHLNPLGLVVLRRARWSGRFRAPMGLRVAQASVARELLHVAEHDLDAAESVPIRQSEPMIRHLVVPLLREIVSDSDALAQSRADQLRDLWSSTVTLLLGGRDGQRLDPELVAPARRRAAEEHIKANLDDQGLTPDSVGKAVGISRRRVYELFAREGVGVAEYIRAARLERVRELLADPESHDQPIGAIAAAAGFPNQAHFSRLFRQTYGETARDYRSRTLFGGSPI